MNVLMVHRWPEVMRGSERSMHLAATALQAQGHVVSLLHGSAPETHLATRYADLLRLPPLFDIERKQSPPDLASAESRLHGWMRERAIDVVHVHYPPRLETLRRLADRVPLVFTAHAPVCPSGLRYLWSTREVCTRDVGLGCIPHGFFRGGCGRLSWGTRYGLLSFLRRMNDDRRFRATLGQLSRIVAPSRWAVERLVQDGVPPDRLRIVAPPIESDDGAELAAALPKRDEMPLVTYVGHLSEAKGADHVLEMSARIAVAHRILFVGDGPLRAPLEARAHVLGMADRVTFLGSQPPREIRAHRARSTVIVVPSLWPETFGMVGPEALLAERPVVAYGAGGVTEWLENGVTGYVVPAGHVDRLAQAVEQLLRNPDEAAAMGRAGRAVARRWAPDAHARALTDVYREACETAAAPS